MTDDYEVRLSQELSSNILVEDRPLFADFGNYSLTPSTKAEGNHPVTLESLLNRKLSSQKTFKSTTIVQIPFLSNNEKCYFATSHSGRDLCQDSILVLKKYLLETKDGSEVVALLAYKAYYDSNKYSEISYFNMPDFNGWGIFSEPNGKFLRLIRYHYGKASLVPLCNEKDANDESVYIVKVYFESTKADDEFFGTIEAAIVQARQSSRPLIDISIPKNPTIWSHNTGAGGVGDDDNDMFYDLSKGKTPLKNTFSIVTVVSNNTDLGTVSGGGAYAPGSSISVSAKAKSYSAFKPENKPVFDKWSGDVSSRSLSINVKVGNDDAFLCGNFKRYGDLERPCVSGSGKSNPLIDCYVVGTANSVDFKAGLFGPVRIAPITYKTKNHGGIDFGAPEGSPIFAPSDGTISVMKTKCPKGKDGNKYGGGFGNYIMVNDGNGTFFIFAHLQHGNPVARNLWSEDGSNYKVGDTVHKGDLIGYTGKSGNAWNVPNSHLHFEVRKNGNKVDPSTYINGSVSASTGVVNGKDCNGTKK